MDTFDYVIVGAGSAGSVLANRLSADDETSICVLEAGGRDWHPFIHIPAGFIKTFYDGRVNWNYSMEPGAWTDSNPRPPGSKSQRPLRQFNAGFQVPVHGIDSVPAIWIMEPMAGF